MKISKAIDASIEEVYIGSPRAIKTKALAIAIMAYEKGATDCLLDFRRRMYATRTSANFIEKETYTKEEVIKLIQQVFRNADEVVEANINTLLGV